MAALEEVQKKLARIQEEHWTITPQASSDILAAANTFMLSVDRAKTTATAYDQSSGASQLLPVNPNVSARVETQQACSLQQGSGRSQASSSSSFDGEPPQRASRCMPRC